MKNPLLTEQRLSMSNSMDKSLIEAGTMDTRMMDHDPLLESNAPRLNIMKAPVIYGFKSFKSGLGENLGRGIYVLFVLTITFMLAQVTFSLKRTLHPSLILFRLFLQKTDRNVVAGSDSGQYAARSTLGIERWYITSI